MFPTLQPKCNALEAAEKKQVSIIFLITVFDINPVQNFYAQLKIASTKHLAGIIVTVNMTFTSRKGNQLSFLSSNVIVPLKQTNGIVTQSRQNSGRKKTQFLLGVDNHGTKGNT